MKENLKAIKRLVAFFLCVFMVGSMIGNDVFVVATEENDCAEYVDEQTYAANVLQPVGEGDGYCDNCGHVEESHIAAEPESVEAAVEEAAEAAAEEPVEGTDISEETPTSIEEPATGETPIENEEGTGQEPVPANDEQNQTPEITDAAETPETTPENIDNPENIEKEEIPGELEEDTEAEEKEGTEEDTEEEETKEETEENEEDQDCEHEWSYVSNGNGTHVKKCAKCGEESTEDCVLNEEGKCELCGYEQEQECEHQWTYTDNGDGTHTKRCELCGEEGVEPHEFGEDGLCIYCGAVDLTLEYQTFAETFGTTTVTVSGQMPRHAKVTIYKAGAKAIENIVNNQLDEGVFIAYEAYNINIYDAGGNKYQPDDNDDTVNVSFTGVDDLDKADDEEVTVYRIEDNYEITEIEPEVIGEDVYFEAEHFSTYVAGTFSATGRLVLAGWEKFAYVSQTTANYTKITGTKFQVELGSKDVTYTIELRKNLESATKILSGDVIDTQFVTAKPSTGSTGTIEVEFDVSGDNAYITNGSLYSVVVSSSAASKIVCGVTSTTTYITDAAQNWSVAPTYNGIFDESGFKQETAETTDAHTIVGIKATKGDASGLTQADTYFYGKQRPDADGNYTPIDTLVAVFDAENVDRMVTWSSDSPSIVEINSKGEIKAKSSGTAKITALYKTGVEYSVNVKVIGVTIDGWDPDDITKTQTLIQYNGQKIEPTVVAEIGNEKPNITKTFSNNETAGQASVEIKYTIGSRSYVLVRSFTISKLPITAAVFTNANVVPSGTEISEFTNLTAITSNADNAPYTKSVTPVYNENKQDFTYTLEDVKVSGSGIVYTFDITGTGNFSGSVTSLDVTRKNINIADVVGVKMPANSRLLDYYYKDDPLTLTETKDGSGNVVGWDEVVFYDLDKNQPLAPGTITPENCSVSLVTSADVSVPNNKPSAGTHKFVFTMKDNSGYTGYISLTFEVKKPSINNAKIKWNNDNYKFYHTGKAVEPVKGNSFDEDVQLSDGTIKKPDYIVLEKKTINGVEQDVVVDKSNYEASFSGTHTAIGTYTITLKGANNYDPETTLQDSYEIIADFALDMRVRLYENGAMVKETSKKDVGSDYETGYTRPYDTTTNAPVAKIYVPGDGEIADTYYTATPSDSRSGGDLTKDAGEKYIIIKLTDAGKTKYPNAPTTPQIATYKVEPLLLTNNIIKVTRKANTKVYNGAEQTLTTATDGSDAATAELTVRYGTTGEVLKEGPAEDYTITYKDNINAGKATYVIEAKKNTSGEYTGNYSGKIADTKNYFTIDKAVIKHKDETDPTVIVGTVDVDGSPTKFKYDGKPHQPEVSVKIDGVPIDNTNYTVTTSSDIISPTGNTDATRAYVQVVGKNNIEGNARIYFDITPNTDGYTGITIDGKSVKLTNDNKAKNDETVGSTVTRYYKMDEDELKVEYTGSDYSKPVVVYGIDSKILNLPGEAAGYFADFIDTDKAKNYDVNDIENSPRLVVTGLGNYAGNNVVVVFNVKQASLTKADIKLTKEEYDFNSSVAVDKDQLQYTISYNGQDIKSKFGDEYTIDCYDDGTNADGTRKALTAAAGKKVAVFKGLNKNFSTDEVELTYYVGKTLTDAYVVIENGNTNTEKFLDSTKLEVLKTNNGSPSSPLANKVKWRGNDVSPKIKLYTADGTAIEASAYTITQTYQDGFTDWRSRKAGEEQGTDYNTVHVTITSDSAVTGYYDDVEFYYDIYPVDIVTASSGGQQEYNYTGSEIKITPVLTYNTGSGTPYALVNNATTKDYIGPTGEATYSIGPDVTNTTLTTPITGVGNFTGEIGLLNSVIKGYAQITYRKDDKSDYVTPPIGATDGRSATGSTAADKTYAWADLTKTGLYFYDGKTYCPTIKVLATDGVTDLTSQCRITYPTEQQRPGIKKITVAIPAENKNLVSETVEIKYSIDTNEIDGYNRTLSDMPYTGEKYTPDVISDMVSNNPDILKVTVGDKTLRFGTSASDTNADYIILQTEEQDFITWKGQKGIADQVSGGNLAPAYASNIETSTNYVWIKGVNTYSGYRKVPFNIILNLSETSLVRVYTDKSSYDLDADGNAVVNAKIMYKGTKNAADFDTQLTGDNYTVSRAKQGLPGPDANITVTGKNACKGEYPHVYPEGSTLPANFLADLGTYKGISISGGNLYRYTGEPIKIKFTGIDNDAVREDNINSNNGDYSVIYTQTPANTTDQFAPTEVGAWYAIIKAQPNSRYFKTNSYSNSAAVLENYKFYIKYYLSDATFKFTSDGTKSGTVIDTVSHTGSAIDVPAVIITADEKHVLYDKSVKDLVELSQYTVTDMGTYTIKATPKTTAKDKVEGEAVADFKVSGVALDPNKVTFATPTDETDLVYKGSAYTPEMVVHATGRTEALTKNVDYTVEYKDNIKAGTAKVIVKGINNYDGTVEKTFKINQKALTADMIEVAECHYIGEVDENKQSLGLKLYPEVTVTFNGKKLTPGVDYEKLEHNDTYYKNNDSIATAILTKTEENDPIPKVVVNMIPGGNFTGSVTKDFTIDKLNLSSKADVDISPTSAEFIDEAYDPYELIKLKVTTGSKTAVLQKYEYDAQTQKGTGDYTITVLNSAGDEVPLKDMGQYYLVISGKNSCDSTQVEIPFVINQRSLPDNFHYYYGGTGTGFVGTVTELKDDANNIIGYQYEGGLKSGDTVTDSLIIKVLDVETVGVEGNTDNKPTVEIIDKGVTDENGETIAGLATKKYRLVPTKDFTIAVKNNGNSGTGAWDTVITDDKHAPVKAGSPTVTITGAGNYTGSISLPYNIGKNINNIVNDLTISFRVSGTVENVSTVNYNVNEVGWNYTYNGAQQVPKLPNIKYGNKTLLVGTDYTLTFTDENGADDQSIEAGWKYAVITGTGTYCGILKQKYAIDKKQVTSPQKDFYNETTMQTTDLGLTFTMSGGTVKRMENPAELLSDVANNSQYTNYFYAIFDGAAIEPNIVVKDNKLAKGAKTSVISQETDLEITWENPATVSTYNASTGALNNCSYVVATFKPSANITDFSNGSRNYYVPTGSTLKYRIAYLILHHNVASDFNIKFDKDDVDGPTFKWDGMKHEPEITVTNGKRNLVRSYDDGETGDYVVQYLDNITPGVATVRVTGKNNYKGTKERTFTIWGDLADTTVYFKNELGNYVSTEEEALPIQDYTGGAIEPEVELWLVAEPNMDQPSTMKLTKGKEYTVGPNTSSDGTFFQDGTITYLGNNARTTTYDYWTGEKSLDYKIQYDEDKVKLTFDSPEMYFTGYPIKIDKEDIKVSISTAVKKDIHYYRATLDSQGNVIDRSEEITDDNSQFIEQGAILVEMGYKVGSADVKYAEGVYKIVSRPISECFIAMDTVQRYTGKAIEPELSVSIVSEGHEPYKLEPYDPVTKTGDYTVKYTDDDGNPYVYSNSENDCKVTLEGVSANENIVGTTTKPYTIKLQDIANLHVTDITGDSISVEWVRELYSDGTQLIIQKLDANGNVESYRVVRVKGRTNTFTFDDLVSSTNYKIIGTAYAVTSDNKTLYSGVKFVERTTDVATTGIKVESNTAGKATVIWNTEGTVSLYYIYISDSANSEGKVVAIIPASTGSFTRSNLTSGKTYYFHVDGYVVVNGKPQKVNTSSVVPKEIK